MYNSSDSQWRPECATTRNCTRRLFFQATSMYIGEKCDSRAYWEISKTQFREKNKDFSKGRQDRDMKDALAILRKVLRLHIMTEVNVNSATAIGQQKMT